MAEAAEMALGVESFQIVADAGYSNGEEAAQCEAAGMLLHVTVMRTVTTRAMAHCSGSKIFATNPRPIPISVSAKRRCDERRSIESALRCL
jgi:hypothetical protein